MSEEAAQVTQPETAEPTPAPAADAPPAEAEKPAEGARDAAPAAGGEEGGEKAAEKAEGAAAGEGGEEAPAKKKWGGWGEDPDEKLIEMVASEPITSRQHALLDDLAVEDPTQVKDEERESITGPDGYVYPPLSKAGVDILRRLWAGELPENREESVKLWEKKVRCAVNVGLAIPVPPRVPATELLKRKAAAPRKETEEAVKDLTKWAIPQEDEAELSEEMKEFNEKGIVAETVTRMLNQRVEARAARDFAEADRLREDLFAMGVEFNDQAGQWRAGDVQGTFNAPAANSSRPPIEINDIDLPASWEEFLALPDPKVLAVGPRNGPQGRRAWGAGGRNWGTFDLDSALQQAMQNCQAQGVHRPKVIWPPQCAMIGGGGGGKGGGWGKGGGKGGGYGGGKGNRFGGK